jgi:hypothetical protein
MKASANFGRTVMIIMKASADFGDGVMIIMKASRNFGQQISIKSLNLLVINRLKVSNGDNKGEM